MSAVESKTADQSVQPKKDALQAGVPDSKADKPAGVISQREIYSTIERLVAEIEVLDKLSDRVTLDIENQLAMNTPDYDTLVRLRTMQSEINTKLSATYMKIRDLSQ